LKTQIEALTDRVVAAQPIARALVELQIIKRPSLMTSKLPNLGGVASAIGKLTSAIEDDAKKFLEKVETVHAKRERVFKKAHDKVAVPDAELDAADQAFDQLDEALGDNGGPPMKEGSTLSS
jgi:hypothetical protein